MQKQKVITEVAFAVAEIAVAYALAKRVANAFADADADAFTNLQELRHRTSYLEAVHGLRWSAVDDCYYASSTLSDHGQLFPTVPDDMRPGSTTLD